MSAKNATLFKGSSAGGDIESLPDGTYKMEIDKASPRDAGDKLVIGFEMMVLWGPEGTPGTKLKYDHWIRDKEGANRFMKTLANVGFDVDQWVKDGNQQEQVDLAIRYMKGMRVEAEKVSKADKDKPNKFYHNLYINGRAEGAEYGDGKPESITNDELAAWAEDNPDLEHGEVTF